MTHFKYTFIFQWWSDPLYLLYIYGVYFDPQTLVVV